jgi:pSer/pThr/pTyr-binding forkhead associated (FHA) protein
MAFHWTLSVLDDDGSLAMVLALNPPGGTLGRGDENAFVLDRDSISTVHCKFSLDPDGDWWVQDLDSTNGIWKDDQQITGLHRISGGEVLELGVIKVRVGKEEIVAKLPEEPSPDQSHRIQVDDESDEIVKEADSRDEPILIESADVDVDWEKPEAAVEGREEFDPDNDSLGGGGFDPRQESELKSDPDPDPDSDFDSDSDFDTEAEPDPVPETEPELKPEVKSEIEPEVKSERKEKQGPQSAEDWVQWAVDKIFLGLGAIHEFLGYWLPVIIGFCVDTLKRLPIPARFSLGFGLMAVVVAVVGWVTLPAHFVRLSVSEEHLKLLEDAGYIAVFNRLILMARLLGPLCVGAAAWAWVKTGRAIKVFKVVLALYTLYWLYVFNFFVQVPSFLNDVDYKGYTKYLRNEHWLRSWTPWSLVILIPLLVMLGTALRSVANYYRREEVPEPLTGDELVDSLKTGGRDPRMRSSSYWSSFIVFFLLALPFLMSTCGREKPYGIPKGSGEPVVEMVKVKQKKKKPKKKMIVNNWSPYIFERMKIDDIKVLEDLDEQSMDTYEIVQEKSGKMGKGGGKKGGWPEGMEGTTVRFIRLEYKGGDWDQEMGKGSDYNLLIRFNQITGFPIARETESKQANRLKQFPKGRKPPFVYLTGKGSMQFSTSEINTLRWYTLEEGGLLFIDHGGGRFGRSVQDLMRRVYPGQPLVDIPNDDPIFQAPFVFPSGAPPLWQHGGSRAKGIRHEGRWVVFYHPGDMGDAWKDGHSGVAPEVAEQAYRMGINVMYYAFNTYYEQHFE